MNKKIVTVILVILISFCFLSIVVAENATHDDSNATDHDDAIDENKTIDKDKVDKANEIYKRLLEISADDKNALDEILAKATSELGLNLINQDKLNELKMKVNPQNFMSPYNAEKVSLANELYAILTKEGLTYSEFADVEEKMKLLGV